MQYRRAEDIPATAPIFPLCGALLLPGAKLPLNIFEPRYLALFDDALAGNRIIGIIQPAFDRAGNAEKCAVPALNSVGCLGRIVSFSETCDGRYIVSLAGVCRFRMVDEVDSGTPYRQARIKPYLADLKPCEADTPIDRAALIASFKAYLDANNLDADWDSVKQASDRTLVNCLAMMSPLGPAEKQALLESPDLKSRAETLIAITEIALADDGDDSPATIQ